MKRNLLWILVAVSLCAWLKPPPLRARYEPNGPPLTVDGVGLDKTTAELDKVLGPGVGEMQRAYRDGKTVVKNYFDPRAGAFRVYEVSGTKLQQSDQVLVQVGDDRRRVEECLGAPAQNTWQAMPTALSIPEELRDAPGREFYLDGDLRIQYEGERVAELNYGQMVSSLSRLYNRPVR